MNKVLLVLLFLGAVACSKNPSRDPSILALKEKFKVEDSISVFSETKKDVWQSSSIHYLLDDYRNQQYVAQEIVIRYKGDHFTDNVEVLYSKDQNFDVLQAVETFKKNPLVKYAEPNYIYKVKETLPNDKEFARQWHLKNTGQSVKVRQGDTKVDQAGMIGSDIKATQAWEYFRKNPNAKTSVVAVIDTGVDYTHPDLQDVMYYNLGENGVDEKGKDKKSNGVDDDKNGYIDDFRGWNFHESDPLKVLKKEDPSYAKNDPMDIMGHGTHVAGIIAATVDNSEGVAGVSIATKIMALRAANERGSFENIVYLRALKYAADNGANVVNLSLGGAFNSELGQEVVDYAKGKNVLVVAAAGNEDTATDHFPSSLNGVLAVEASDHLDGKASFSNFGANVFIAAPGLEILSTVPVRSGAHYMEYSGTSMACPVVAGVAGLVYAYYPGISVDEVFHRIVSTADNVDLQSRSNNILGVGRVNALNALTLTTPKELPYLIVSKTYYVDGDMKGTRVSVSPGEDVVLAFELRNNGKIAKNVKLHVHSQNPLVEIAESEVLFKNIPDGQRVLSSNAALLKLSPLLIAGTLLKLNVKIEADGYTAERVVALNVTQSNAIGRSIPVKTNKVAPVLSDLDRDGKQDVIFTGLLNNQEMDVTKLMMVINGEGDDLPGFPLVFGKEFASKITGDKDIEMSYYDSTPASVGDIDGDGNQDVVFEFSFHKSHQGFKEIYFVHDSKGEFNKKIGIFFSQTTPVLEDMNGDGKLEIIVTDTVKEGDDIKEVVMALQYDGTRLFTTNLDFKQGTYLLDSIATGDLNNDGKKEIVLAILDGNLEKGGAVYTLSHNGDIVKKIVVEETPGDLVLASLTGDNQVQIILGTQKFSMGLDLDVKELSRIIGPLYAWDDKGKLMPGFPVRTLVEKGENFHYDPDVKNLISIADLDKDKKPEIIIGDYINRLYAFKSDGSLVNGWPVKATNAFRLYPSGTVVADIDGDASPEIMMTGAWNDVRTFTSDGREIEAGFGKLSLTTGQPLAIGDLFGNGFVSVVGTSFNSGLYSWKTIGKTNSVEWAMYRGNARHTGMYGVK